MPVVTTFLIGTAIVTAGQWLIWDRPSDSSRPDPPYSSLASLIRHVRGRGPSEASADDSDDLDAYASLPDEHLASYQRIVTRQKSLHLLAGKRQAEREASVSASSRQASSSIQPPTSTAMTARQPSLTLSVASSRSSASSSAAQPNLQTASATSTAPSTHLPVTPEQQIIVLPPQVINDAQDDEEEGVVGSWLGTMEREVVAGVVGGCGAVNCAGTRTTKTGGSEVCGCIEEGERSIRGRRMSYC